ncbi:MAG: type II secretion system protein N [Rhodoferax sp.]
MKLAALAPRIAAFSLAGMAAASAVGWGLRWSAPRSLPQATPLAGAAASVDGERVARALGAATGASSSGPAAVAASSMVGARLALQGVVAPKGAQGGAALIAVDGKPPKPYRVGAEVVDGWRLVAVAPRRAELAAPGQGSGSTLELPNPAVSTAKPPFSPQ